MRHFELSFLSLVEKAYNVFTSNCKLSTPVTRDCKRLENLFFKQWLKWNALRLETVGFGIKACIFFLYPKISYLKASNKF